jgi:hypothetical protein
VKVGIIGKNGHALVNINRRKAIHEKCLNCAGWLHKEVTNCFHEGCELYLFRTGKGPQIAADRSRSIRAYCLACCNGQVGEVSKCPCLECPLYLYRMGSIDRAISDGFRENKATRRVFFNTNAMGSGVMRNNLWP